MGEITEEALVDLAGELVDRPTPNPPGTEGELAEFLVDRLESSPISFDVGVETVAPDRPNVVARAGDPGFGSLLLTGHTDVVPATEADWTGDPYEMRRVGERLVGRGTADMKGALAAKLLAAESYLSGDGPHGEVILGFVVDEEVGQTGTRALAASGIDADGAIIGEPTDLQLAIAEYGMVGYTITTEGKSTHSGRPDRGTNAIDALRRILDGVEAIGDEEADRDHPLFTPGPSVSITEIEGGIGPNVVPDRAEATVTWRTLPGDGDGPAPFDRRIREAVDGARLEGNSVDAEVDRWFFSSGIELDSESRLARTVLAAAADIDLPCGTVGFNAGTDAPILVNEAGIPTVLVGPGTIESDAHTVDESVAIEDLHAVARLYERTLERFLG